MGQFEFGWSGSFTEPSAVAPDAKVNLKYSVNPPN
jgi:hypothetical protein